MAQKEKQYLVKWEIDITANSPLEAAKLALEIQRDKSSEALVFDVHEQESNSTFEIDLFDESQPSGLIVELEHFQKLLKTNIDIDWSDESAVNEFATLSSTLNKIIKRYKEKVA